MEFTTLRFDSIDSTNSEALRQAASGAAEGLVIVAGEQTAGRGRQGRQWVSGKGTGLYLSILLRPKIHTRFLPLITLMSAVAVHDSLTHSFGLLPDIKWPNDILINEKKICGILAETTEMQIGLAVVVGVGINLRSMDAPGLIETATSLEAVSPPWTMPEVESSVLRFLDYWYEVLHRENGPSSIIDAWQQRSTYFSGKRVSVTLESETITGTTDGLEPSGALRIKEDDGRVLIIHSGDVQRLREQHV